jgi:hypothetical protein
MTPQERTDLIASLRGWRQTLAAQAQAYLENPYHRGVDFSQWTRDDCARAVLPPYSTFTPACLCHEEYLIDILMQMLPTRTCAPSGTRDLS